LREGILASAGWSQETYCSEIPAKTDPFACEVSLGRVRAAASMYSSATTLDQYPIAAAYFFSVAAYPGTFPPSIDFESVYATREACPNAVEDTFASDCWAVHALPGTLAPVKARQVYMQTWDHAQESAKLNLVWRLEVTLPDNSYEAYVSVHNPSQIIASIDWVSDAPAPNANGWLTSLQEKVFGQNVLDSSEEVVQGHIVQSHTASAPGGSYRVWKWGVNDPVSGDRTLEVSPSHKDSSPYGWHSVPTKNDPIDSNSGGDADAIHNFTTTVGNNVRTHIRLYCD
jgi:extracellular elastinolytic metalloproteinase